MDIRGTKMADQEPMGISKEIKKYFGRHITFYCGMALYSCRKRLKHRYKDDIIFLLIV